MHILIPSLLFSIVASSLLPIINKEYQGPTKTQPTLDMTDEMSFRAVRPWVPIVDIAIPNKNCDGGECKPEVPLDQEKLKKYQIYSRMMSVGYCQSALIDEWTCGVCNEPGSPLRNTTDVRYFRTPHHTVHGVMTVNHDLRKVFLVFQGVQDPIQWALSIHGLFQTKFETNNPNAQNIKVHPGFYSAFLDVKDMIINDVIKRMEKYPSYNLVVMGHSFGGAMASMMASSMAIGNFGAKFVPSKIELVSLGAPRVGNKYFAESIDKAGFADVARIVHSTDMVARVPSTWFGYQHFKGEVWLSSISKKWVTCDDRNPSNPGESLNCARSVGLVHVSEKTHVSYWSRKKESYCPMHMSSKPMEIMFLPKFGLIKY